jgi:hypothetical protein
MKTFLMIAIFTITTQALALGFGGSMDCLVQNECPGEEFQQQEKIVVAVIEENGKIVFQDGFTEIPRSIEYHGKNPAGESVVSCSGGCSMVVSKSFFGTTVKVCDTEGICLDFFGSVRPKKHKEISN